MKMKQEDDKWIKAFRDRMKDHSESVPAGIWDSLEKELSPVRPISVYPFRRLAAVAAVLVAVVSLVSLYFLFSPADGYMNDVPKVVVLEEPVSADPVFVKPVVAEPVLVDAGPIVQKRSVQLVEKEEDRPRIEGEVGEKELEKIAEIPEDKTKELSHGDDTKVRQTEKKGHVSSGSPRTRIRVDEPITKRGRKWAVSLAMGNSPATMNNNNMGFGTLSGNNNSTGLTMAMNSIMADNIDVDVEELREVDSYKRIFSRSVRNETYTDVKHKMPVTFGASFRYNLSKQFAIETGIIYTLLSSELKAESEKGYYYVENQKLHYLGIPVKGNWIYLDRKHFSLYLSAGGTMEKSISGKRDTDFIIAGHKDNEKSENLNVKPLQWSVSAAAGIQYNATKNFGIYVEPGVVHYFDDGTSVQTIRKEKPTNFNLQMGLRLTY